MKVFVSSLITGMEPIRAAAREAITTLRHDPIMAEDFGAQPRSPQVACLSGVRQSDLVILILGERYGTEQPLSGLSATHEEYREAKTSKPVIAFVQEPATFEPRQKAYVEEVEGWSGGLIRVGFRNVVELQRLVTRALHDHALANAVGPVDEAQLASRALALLPRKMGNSYSSPLLSLAVAGGPTRQLLRPAEIEDRSLWDELAKTALYGDARLFDDSKGIEKGVVGAALVLSQGRDGEKLQLDEQGGVLVELPLGRASGNVGMAGYSLPVLLQENVSTALGSALAYAAWLLEKIDPTQKLTHVAVAARIGGGEYLAWRTQAEHAASPTSVSMGPSGHDRPAVQVGRRRAALRLDRQPLVEDLLVPLRRQWKR